MTNQINVQPEPASPAASAANGLGPLPDGWKIGRLNEIFSVIPKRQRETRIQDGQQYQLLTVRLYAKGVTLRTIERGERIKTKALYRTESGDFVFSKIDARNGAWGFVPQHLANGLVSGDFPLLALDYRRADPIYLTLALSRPGIWTPLRDLAAGTTNRRRLSVPEFLEVVCVPLPPLPEQRAIAHVLRTVQRSKEATEQVIAATRALKQSLMRHLFTYGPVPVDQADQVPLKETEIGPVPEHWQIVRLGDVAAIGNGSTPKRTNNAYWSDGTIPWLTSAKVHDVVIRTADEYVTHLAQEECHLPLVRKGSILVAITGQGRTLGNAALVTFDTYISQHLAYIQLRRLEMIPEYVLAFLRGRYDHLREVSQAGGSTKGALTCAFLKTYPMPTPSLEEQQAICDALSAVDQKLDMELSRSRSLELLFHSLLHNLMSGKVRVGELRAIERAAEWYAAIQRGEASPHESSSARPNRSPGYQEAHDA